MLDYDLIEIRHRSESSSPLNRESTDETTSSPKSLASASHLASER